MARKKKDRLTRQERIDLLKAVGKGIIELTKAGPVPRYAVTTLGLYALGRTCLIPTGLISGIQGVNTIIAISEVTEDTGMFSGITNSVLSGSGGVAAGLLMEDALSKKCNKDKRTFGTRERESITGRSGEVPTTYFDW